MSSGAAAIPAFASREAVTELAEHARPVRYRAGALVATTRSAGLLLSRDRFLGLLDQHEPVRRHVLSRLAADSLALRERVADATTLPAVARVARWLLATGDWHGSQEDLARTLGVGRVTVNRALGRLARVAALRVTQGGVRVVDANRLAIAMIEWAGRT
jgi:CRP/FNR family transcriptional regulator, cyclic AMP receptor protein